MQRSIIAMMALPGAFAVFAPDTRADLLARIKTTDGYGGCFASPMLGPNNEPIKEWDVSRITDFSNLFYGCDNFNQNISAWDVSKGAIFYWMFGYAAFNQDISTWDVSKGTDFYSMFRGATAFNQDISAWDVSKGTEFRNMLYQAAAFDLQHTALWDTSSASTTPMSNPEQPCPPGSTRVANYGTVFERCSGYVPPPLYAPECGSITIAEKYLNGSITVFGLGYSDINVLEETLDVIVYETAGARGARTLSMTCDGTNVQTKTFLSMATSAGSCQNPDDSTTHVDVSYAYSMSINDVFTNASLTQDAATGNFSAIYQPKCVLSIDDLEISTVEYQYTATFENGIVIDIKSQAVAEVIEEETVNEDIGGIVGVILDNPDITFVDGEVVVLQFNLEGLVAENIPQKYFQIDDITDLTITVDNVKYTNVDFSLLSSVDTELGRTVSFLLPTEAYGTEANLVQIDGTALIALADGSGRRRSLDVSAILQGGDTEDFSLTTIAQPKKEDPSSESSAHTVGALSTTAVAAYGLVALSACL